MASRGVNKVILVGNIGQEPETRYTPSGSAVCNFSVATSETWKDKNTGEQQEKTEWHRVVMFGKLGEIGEKYLHKGSKVYIEGRLQTRSWEKDGVTRYATEINAQNMQMLDSRGSPDNQQQDSGNPFQSAQQHTPSQQPAPANFDNFDDDIPF